MNDIYLETPDLDGEDDVRCANCDIALDNEPGEMLVGDLHGSQPFCAECGGLEIAEYRGHGRTIHDRREDAEALLRDIGAWLAGAHPVSPPEAIAFRAAIAKR